MDEKGFLDFMKREKKPAKTIQGNVISIQLFEDYLKTHGKTSGIAASTEEDLKSFVQWGVNAGENVYRHFWGIRTYYQFLGQEQMFMSCSEWMEFLQNETRRLSEFPKVSRDAVKKLSKMGVSTVNHFLRTAAPPEKRAELARQSGVPSETLEELFKLAELSRLPGLKKVRGRLFYEAGLDSLDAIAVYSPQEVQEKLQAYIDTSGFKGSAPTEGESEFTVRMAKFLQHRPLGDLS